MQFLNKDHENRFMALTKKDHTYERDRERQALFFIIAGEPQLFENVDQIYNFKDRMIKTSVFKESFMTSGYMSLLALAFNLYGFEDHDVVKADVLSIFAPLDEERKKLAIMAMAWRFQIYF